MNKSPESPIFSDEHYKFLQLDTIKRAPVAVPAASVSEEKSLREFNADLLQKIGDYRKKNLELTANENHFKNQLALQTKQANDRERELISKFQREIESLKRAQENDRLDHEHASEEWARKLSKLTDEAWERGLEIETLRRDEAFALEQRTYLEQQIKEAAATEDRMREEFGIALDRESQLVGAFEALRADYSNIDAGYRDSLETIARLQEELRARDERQILDLAKQEQTLKATWAQDAENLRTENTKLRELLGARETRIEQDRVALHTWREQLTFLDQCLRQQGDSIKKEQADLAKLARAVQDEVQFAIANPFTDYLEIAQKEVAHIEAQLSGTAAMSPLRGKLEVRLASAKSHRDQIVGILENAKAGMNEHSVAIERILKQVDAKIL